MCGPLAAFAVSALSSVVSFMAATEESKAVEKSATEAYKQDQKVASLRQIQEQDATAQKLHLANIDEAEKRATVEVSGAEAGVAGISVNNLLADVTRKAATNRQTERENLRMTTRQLQLDKEGSRARNQGRINSAPRPNPLGLVAGIAGAGIKAFGQIQ